MFKTLAQENSGVWFGKFRSSNSSDFMRVGDSLRSLRSWR
jgi:hypothetical protein